MGNKIDIKRMVNARKIRGMLLLEYGFEPQEIDDKTWIITSQKGNQTYTVKRFSVPHRYWTCTCPDFQRQCLPCKHIQAVKIWKKLGASFEEINPPIKHLIRVKDSDSLCCKFCNSDHIIRYGKQNGKQYYMCKECNRRFVDNIDFENMKYDPKIIALTLDLYFKGVSLRKISHHLEQFYSLSISHRSVYNWIEKYVGIMNEYVNSIQPDIGGVWHTDEMQVKFDGSWEYLWNVIDERTRFQLASVVSKERRIRDARMVFQRAKLNSGGRKPKYIVTDGLQSYKHAVGKEFITNTDETEHLWNVGLEHHPNNNHVERLHGTIRDREKTFRGLKKENTPIVEGHRLYYNFIKPHESLDSRTPAEEAGITIKGDNKWLILMRKAVQYQNSQK